MFKFVQNNQNNNQPQPKLVNIQQTQVVYHPINTQTRPFFTDMFGRLNNATKCKHCGTK